VTGRRGRRHKQLLDDLKEKRGYWILKEEALDHDVSRTRLGRDYGPVVRPYTMSERMCEKYGQEYGMMSYAVLNEAFLQCLG
jgi:hypothetical protein